MKKKKPDYNKLLEKAILLASEVHKGQVDKAGLSYILHPLRVMSKMNTAKEKIVAILHDVIEDASCSEKVTKRLYKEFPLDIVLFVKILSRKKKESYSEYIRKVKLVSLPTKVKIADLEDNLNLLRLKKLSDISIDSLRMYLEAWQELNRAL